MTTQQFTTLIDAQGHPFSDPDSEWLRQFTEACKDSHSIRLLSATLAHVPVEEPHKQALFIIAAAYLRYGFLIGKAVGDTEHLDRMVELA